MYFCEHFRYIVLNNDLIINSLHIMNKIIHSECPLCNSTTIEKRFACKDYFASGESFDVFECKECGFTFTQGIPVETEIGKYYESPEYVSHSNTNKGLLNKLFHLVRSIMLRRKVSLIKKLTLLRKGKQLDYGAGIGYFANSMQKAGWSVTAIEKSSAAREQAKELFGLEILPEEALSKLPDKEYNAITLWHVMEHIQQLDNFWEQMHRILDDSGIAIIAVPNCASYDAEFYGEHWAAYDVPRHLWHFTSSTIAKIASKHNFILERRYPMPFDGFYISMLSERYKGRKSATLRGVWNGFLGWIASWDKCSASSSIIYIFRKKR